MEDIVEWFEQLNSKVKTLLKFLCFVVVVGSIVWLFNLFLYAPTVINGDSMRPSLSDGDIIIIDKITYRMEEIERYDIVAFKYKYDYSQMYIKRVIGMPGETIYMKDNKIFILNENTGEYEQLKEYYGLYKGENKYPDCEPMTLGEDEYFVLGDNRNDSEDSRSSVIGAVKRNLIIGKAFFRILPFNGIGSLEYQ